MTRVHLVTEDRTGGGLAAVLHAEAEHQRRLCGKARLQFSRPSTVNGNAELLKQCEKYELFRFNYSPRCDHVFYVIDARNAWDLPQLGVQAPPPPLRAEFPLLHRHHPQQDGWNRAWFPNGAAVGGDS
ncbi:hypothetical protein [Archangium violaceum]|uniref:hypothetical protein n=1 Tax=Archangium violaceum TaxID=83451 RepID=UPI00126A22B9|nr:hypothetical protein [Archangium violaceum]